MGFHNQNKQYGFSSVKPREAEVVKEKNIKNKLFISIIVLAIAVLAGSLFVGLKNDLFKFDKVFSFLTNEESKEENILQNDSENIENNTNNLASVSSPVYGNSSNNTTVKLAILANPDLFDYKNQPVIGCDAIVFAKTEIEKTPKILNATLDLLFNDDFDYGFTPANFISTQKDLNFDSAVIENSVAKIFLTGKINPVENDCDKVRIQTQITETAKQFGTVKSVEIYLNGEKFEI